MILDNGASFRGKTGIFEYGIQMCIILTFTGICRKSGIAQINPYYSFTLT